MIKIWLYLHIRIEKFIVWLKKRPIKRVTSTIHLYCFASDFFASSVKKLLDAIPTEPTSLSLSLLSPSLSKQVLQDSLTFYLLCLFSVSLFSFLSSSFNFLVHFLLFAWEEEEEKEDKKKGKKKSLSNLSSLSSHQEKETKRMLKKEMKKPFLPLLKQVLQDSLYLLCLFLLSFHIFIHFAFHFLLFLWEEEERRR